MQALPFGSLRPGVARLPAGTTSVRPCAPSARSLTVVRAKDDSKEEAAKKALQDSLKGMFRGKDILADFDGPPGGGGGGGGGGGSSFWGNWRDPNEWRRGALDTVRMFGSFFRELWNATLAFTVFLAIVWGIGNIPDVLHLIQMLIVKILRLDGGSKRARLEAKVKAAQETSGGAGRDSLGVAESTVTAKWASDDEGSDDDFASEE